MNKVVIFGALEGPASRGAIPRRRANSASVSG
jgi:hypothetical protein